MILLGISPSSLHHHHNKTTFQLIRPWIFSQFYLLLDTSSGLSSGEKWGVADFGYDFYFLVVPKLLNNKYLRLFNFYFHTLIQQRQKWLIFRRKRRVQGKIAINSHRQKVIVFKRSKCLSKSQEKKT